MTHLRLAAHETLVSSANPTTSSATRPPVVPAKVIHIRMRHFLPEDDGHEPCVRTSATLAGQPSPAAMWDEAASVIAAWQALTGGGLAHQAPHAIDIAIDMHDGPTWFRTLADDSRLLDLTGESFHARVYQAIYGVEAGTAPAAAA